MTLGIRAPESSPGLQRGQASPRGEKREHASLESVTDLQEWKRPYILNGLKRSHGPSSSGTGKDSRDGIYTGLNKDGFLSWLNAFSA